jgi:hypothetical protein
MRHTTGISSPQHRHFLASAAAIQSILLDDGIEVKSQLAERLDHQAKGASGKPGGVSAGEEGGECRGGLGGGRWLEEEDVR